MNPEIIGSVSIHSPHDADYEHNFGLSNQAFLSDIYDTESEKMMCEIAEKAAQRVVEPLRRELSTVQVQLKTLQEQYTDVVQENEKLKEKIIKLDSFDRKKNLKFTGFREQKGESKFDTKRAILGMLQTSGIHLHPKAIEGAYRVGPHIKNRDRPIIAKFLHGEERDFVHAKSAHIHKVTGIRTEEDLPEEIEKRRRLLKPIAIKANNTIVNKRHKYQATFQDKLKVNGKIYSMETINRLPEDIHPSVVYTPSNNGITAFFGRLSPLSNHHIAPQKLDNRVFNCNEQFYMYEKAKTFNDHTTAETILREKDPVEQKKLGSKIKDFKESAWRNKCLEIMERGLSAKLEQNPSIKEFLINTGTNMLVEANPRDSYWGIGSSTHDWRTWIKNSWCNKATNHMGRLLAELRTIYKRK